MASTSQKDEAMQSTLPSEEVIDFAGLLFDMDGTIINSTNAIERHWHKVGEKLGVDPDEILAKSHGRRTIDVLKDYDPKLANWDYIRQVESCIPHEFGHDAVEIPGSRALLTSIANASNKNNKNRKNDIASHGKTSSTNVPWAIVTSGTAPLVNAWLNVMKIDAHPPHLISAETVAHGKPDPEGYLLALRKLGLHTSSSTSPSSPTSDRAAGAEQSKGQNDPGQERNGRSSKDCKNYDTKDVLVLEDSPAGVRAGKAAGCRVVALLTTHEQCALEEAGADWIVKDMRSVVFKGWKDAAAASSAAAEKDGNVERGVVSIAIINNVRSKRG